MNNPAEPPLTINWKKNLVFIWISQFLAMAGFSCCMPFIPLLLRENMHITDDHVRGFYVSAYYLAGMVSLCIATAFWGILADRFGRKIMLLRASYAAALFYPLLALAPNFGILLLIRFICSFFSGTVNPAQALLVTTTPSDKHGFVLGTLSTSIWSGHMVGYLAGGMIVHYFGYNVAFFSCGLIYLISGILPHLFVNENFDCKREKKNCRKEKFSFRELASPAVIWVLGMFLMVGIARRIDDPFVAMQVELVNGKADAAFYTGLTSAGAALGGFFSGILTGCLCDRFLPRKLIIPILIASSVASLAQALSINIEMLIVSRFLTYFAAGGLSPVLQVMLTKVSPPERRGTYFGWSGSLGTAGGIVCAFISGGLAYFSGIRGIFIAAAVFFFLMIPLMIPTLRAMENELPCNPDNKEKGNSKSDSEDNDEELGAEVT